MIGWFRSQQFIYIVNTISSLLEDPIRKFDYKFSLFSGKYLAYANPIESPCKL